MSYPHKNFAWATISQAPSPAISGTSVTVVSLSNLPSEYPYPAIFIPDPTTTEPTNANTEEVMVTANSSGTTLTITRGDSPISVTTSHRLIAGATAEVFDQFDEELDDISDELDTIEATLLTKSDTTHTHDDRYYTETEVDTLLTGKSDTTHTHDGRYYTETETNALLDNKADTSHTHTTGDITSLAEYVRDTIGNTLAAGNNISVTPDDANDSITIAATEALDGEDGASAYEVAVANGFEGDETAWLASLVGETGPQGPQGDKGDKGDTGETGATGATGADGADGAAATITVGTVTTVDPDDDATVTNVGTTSAAVFNFEIPKGDKGTDGTGAGDVVGPSSSTDNTVARFDATTGKAIQGSGVVIDDSDNLTIGKLLLINATSGNPEFDFQENGTTRGKTYYDVANNRLVFQNNENNNADALYFADNATFTGNIVISGTVDGISVATADAANVKLTGNQIITGVKTFSSFPVTPSSAPTTDYQTANKKYVDDNSVYVGGDIMSGSLGMDGNTVYGLATPTSDDHAATKGYVDDGLDNKLDTSFASGVAKITVGTTEPSSPSTGDLWVDTN